MREPVRFPTTAWHAIREDRDEARAALYDRYRAPVLAFLRNRGFQDADAEDLAHEVFLRVCRPEFVRKADPRRGRFRSLLLSVVRHVVLHHRARRKPAASEAEPLAADPLEREFESLWARNLLDRALGRLRAESPAFHDAIRLTVLEGASYRDAAGRLGASEGDIKNWSYLGKRRLRDLVAEQIGGYCSSQEEAEEELAALKSAMAGGIF